MRGEVGAIQLRAFCLVLSLRYWFFAIEKSIEDISEKLSVAAPCSTKIQ
jgi:hypothetical protein